MTTVVVLIRERPGHQPRPPRSTQLGRAAIDLAREGIEVVLAERVEGGRAWGYGVRGDVWRPVDGVEVAAAHDRFPSQTWPEPYAAALEGLGGRPLGNPTRLTLLCRDKLRCQRFLEASGVAMPELVTASGFQALEAWGMGFLKPRHGGLGRGIRRVVAGDPLEARGPGAVKGQDDELLLQRGVRPPEGTAGVVVRWLWQRESGGWVPGVPVARISRDDPVVNVSRGAEAALATSVLDPQTLEAASRTARRACDALAALGPCVLELGLDFAIDPEGVPHLIEVNSRPGGRMKAVSDRDPLAAAAHLEAVRRPIRYLARL